MEKKAAFEDFDDENVFKQSQQRALNDATYNFVVEFGKGKALVAFDVGVEDVRTLFDEERNVEIPVRWM